MMIKLGLLVAIYCVIMLFPRRTGENAESSPAISG